MLGEYYSETFNPMSPYLGRDHPLSTERMESCRVQFFPAYLTCGGVELTHLTELIHIFFTIFFHKVQGDYTLLMNFSHPPCANFPIFFCEFVVEKGTPPPANFPHGQSANFSIFSAIFGQRRGPPLLPIFLMVRGPIFLFFSANLW